MDAGITSVSNEGGARNPATMRPKVTEFSRQFLASMIWTFPLAEGNT